MESKSINPHLAELDVLVGKWNMKVFNASFLANSEETIEDIATFEWTENGNILSFSQGVKSSNPDTTWATWLIGRDHDTMDYTILYCDNRQVTRVYNMSFNNNVLKIWRNAPDFSQRFEAILDQDANTLSGSWEKLVNGKDWVHDFNITYTKIK